MVSFRSFCELEINMNFVGGDIASRAGLRMGPCVDTANKCGTGHVGKHPELLFDSQLSELIRAI
jgi:hypothetical protein